MLRLDELNDDDLQEMPRWTVRKPRLEDAAKIHDLICSCSPLDQNSTYCYLLLCSHFDESCVVALCRDEVIAFLSGYIPPSNEEVFFVWQVAVDERFRGLGVGKMLLLEALGRRAVRGCLYLETTISPSNHASKGLFRSLARHLFVPIEERTRFHEGLFGEGGHESEDMFRIGPMTPRGDIHE